MKKIEKPAMLAMLGGGQLGRFFVIAAQKLGYKVTVLDPDIDSPAGKLADVHLCKKYDDLDALNQIARECQGASTEFENIPAETLNYLQEKIIVRPSAYPVSIAQNRILEKNFLKDNNFPVGDFEIINIFEDIEKVDISIFPAILKIAQFGYDGKGQIHVNTIEEVQRAFNNFNCSPCVLEKKFDLDTEVSVVLARAEDNKKVFYPVIENKHVNGILDTSTVPANIKKELALQAIKIADSLSTKLNYIGVMAVEFFISNDLIFVNEIAPRPHNSGHFSLDACINNQFDQQVRALTGMPLADTSNHYDAVMVNLLGDIWYKDEKIINPPFEDITSMELPIGIHLYGKKEPRKSRKMGHFTVTGKNLEEITNTANQVKKILFVD